MVEMEMKKLLALLVIVALALSAVQPAMACGERRGQSRCCPCGQKSMMSTSCCCRPEPATDTSLASQTVPIDAQILNLPVEHAVFTTLFAAATFRVEARPGDQHATLPPLFLLGGAFLS
jgi:hypothetical protein